MREHRELPERREGFSVLRSQQRPVLPALLDRIHANENRRKVRMMHKDQQVWDRLIAGPTQAISLCHTI